MHRHVRDGLVEHIPLLVQKMNYFQRARVRVVCQHFYNRSAEYIMDMPKNFVLDIW